MTSQPRLRTPSPTGNSKRRSDVARAARLQKGAGIHKDRRLPRGGSRNRSREWVEEYLLDLEEEEEEKSQLLWGDHLPFLDPT